MFDLPLQNDYISVQFARTHDTYQKQFTQWSLTATRRKVIGYFWFRQVLMNFVTILFVAVAIVLPFRDDGLWSFAAVFMAGSISFLVVTLFNYWPMYYVDFLPKLDSIVEGYKYQERQKSFQEWENQWKLLQAEKMQLEADRTKLEIERNELAKCRKSQLSNFSLALVVYALDKAEGWGYLQANKKSAQLLTRLFGKDADDIQKKLGWIHSQKPVLKQRGRTELRNQFDEAEAVVEELNHIAALNVLRKLELKFME